MTIELYTRREYIDTFPPTSCFREVFSGDPGYDWNRFKPAETFDFHLIPDLGKLFPKNKLSLFDKNGNLKKLYGRLVCRRYPPGYIGGLSVGTSEFSKNYPVDSYVFGGIFDRIPLQAGEAVIVRSDYGSEYGIVAGSVPPFILKEVWKSYFKKINKKPNEDVFDGEWHETDARSELQLLAAGIHPGST